MKHDLRIDPVMLNILIHQIINAKFDTVENQAETILDQDGVKSFTNAQLNWLKSTRVEELTISEITVPENGKPFFTLSANGFSLNISGRPPTNGEFRGETVRQLLLNTDKNKSLYNVFDTAIHVLKDNPNFIYATNAIRLNWLADHSGDLSPDDLTFQIYAQCYTGILNEFGEAVLNDKDLDLSFSEDEQLKPESLNQLHKMLQKAITNNPGPGDEVLNAQDTLLKIEQFNKQLKDLKSKITDLDGQYHNARKAGQKLITDLETTRNDFYQGKINLNQFTNDCSKACQKAEHTELSEHRGIKQIITNIVMILATLLTAGLALVATGFELPKVNTDSVNKIQRMKATLDDIKHESDESPEEDRSPHP